MTCHELKGKCAQFSMGLMTTSLGRMAIQKDPDGE